MSAGELHTSTKLGGYVWVANTEKVIHVPRDQADDVEMEDDDVQEETQFLPSLQVIVRPQVKTSKEEDVSSLQREETSQQAGPSEDEEPLELDIARIRRPEDRYGHFIVRQLKPEHPIATEGHGIQFTKCSPLMMTGEGRSPLCRDEIGYFSLAFMLEYLASESLTTFMETFGPSTRTDTSYDEHHDFHLELKRVAEAKQECQARQFWWYWGNQILWMMIPTFLFNVVKIKAVLILSSRVLFKAWVRENKQIILETEDDDLVDCTTMWLSMYNKTVQKKWELSSQRQKKKKLKLKRNKKNHRSLQFHHQHRRAWSVRQDGSFLSGSKARSSFQKEEPVPPEGSLQKEVSGEPQADLTARWHDTAPKSEPAKRLYFGADITGNEGDSFFRKLAECFYWWLPWWMGRILQSRLSSFFSTSTYVLACEV